MKDASMPRDQTYGREHQNFGEWNGTRVGCTKPSQEMPDNEEKGGRRARRICESKQKVEALENSCSETAVPKPGEPKQLNQTGSW